MRTGRVRWRRERAAESLETAGFVKSFWLGPALLVYRQGGEWHLQIGPDRWAVGDPGLRFGARPHGIFLTLLVDTPSGSHRCVDFSPLEWLGSRADPTYDGIDAEASDFPRWLAGLRREAAGT